MHSNSVTDKYLKIKNLITSFEEKYGRPKGSVALVAVSKGQSLEKMREIYAAGQTIFGENYLQEALNKIALLHQNKQIEWHFIGSIQSNKTRKIASIFEWVHSIADKKIAKRLNDQRPTNLPPLNICIEVNISHELSKFGTTENGVLELTEYCQTLPHLKLRGLMSIPALQADFHLQRQAFKHLRILYEGLLKKGYDLDTLSIGTSHDFEAAIAEGATMIRLGTALFGPRSEK